MKLRKILTSTVAVTACVAMLSTNVLAASFTTGASGNKLTVVINSDETAQATFLAVDAGTTLTSVEGGDIQYIDQGTLTELGTIAFAKRAGGDSKVDLYSGGENVEMFSMKSVYVESGLAVAAGTELNYTYETTASEFDTAKATELLAGVNFEYTAIGETAATTVAFDAAKFTVATPVISGDAATVKVTYEGVSVDVPVTLSAPSPVASIAITGAPTAAIYVNDAAAYDDAAAKADLANATVTATRGNGKTFSVNHDDLTFAVAAGAGENEKVVTITYGENITTTVSLTVITKAITGGVVVGGATATLTTRDATTVTKEQVEKAVKDAGIKVTYTWNYGATSEATDLTYNAVKEGDVWKVTITSPVVTLTDNVITVTVVENAATLIKGVVKANDATGQVGDFTGGTPVGAVVTVMTYNEDAMGNVANTEEGFTAKAVVVGADGSFEVEVEPESGDYQVIISHVKYSIYGGEVFAARSVLDGTTNQIVTVGADDVNLGTITLRYTFFGDVNANGTLDSDDFGLFTQGFGSSIPELD